MGESEVDDFLDYLVRMATLVPFVSRQPDTPKLCGVEHPNFRCRDRSLFSRFRTRSRLVMASLPLTVARDSGVWPRLFFSPARKSCSPADHPGTY